MGIPSKILILTVLALLV